MPPTSRRQQKILERQKQEATNRKQKTSSYVNQAPFRYAERNFKSRVPPPDYSKVVDLHHYDSEDPRIVKISLPNKLVSPFFREQDYSAYLLNDIPGLIIIQNPFTDKAQRHFIRECLKVYSQTPNTSNLDTHYNIPTDGLWNFYERENRGDLGHDYCVPRKQVNNSTKSGYDSSSSESDEKPDPLPVETVPLLPPSQLIYKMRWVTLGYQYHWPTKTYHFDRRYDVPQEVDGLTRAVVTAIEGVGHNGWKNTYRGSDYRTEAGVVNYYQYRDTLMGHVDRSELNMQAPLVSISYGNDCIYLIGGTTRETEPVPLRLHSGDIIIMTEPCRRCFHGVPLIIENTLPSYLSPDKNHGEDDWEIYGRYMSTSRINLNLRQVYPLNADQEKEENCN